jgi:DNA-binding winged helix-turn-helix (wHTH) protein
MRIQFGAFVLDRATRQLCMGNVPQRLQGHAFQLLELLAERRPAAVSKQEIRDRLWPDTFVSDSTLSSLAAQVRRALGRDGPAASDRARVRLRLRRRGDEEASRRGPGRSRLT